MNISWREIIWQQFGAAIDDLENSLRACPDDLWRARLWDDPANEKFFLPEYWYIIYHTLFWIDLYLTGSSEGFAPPAPFIRGRLPEKPYTKEQLQTYLAHCRHKCQSTLEGLTEESANQLCTFKWIEASFAEMQLYCMRHVQEHAAQLSFMLTQHGVSGFDWVTQARSIPT
jgi:hypothetical protein